MGVAITPNTPLAERIRQVVYDKQEDGAVVVTVDLMLDIANEIETRDQNLVFLTSCMAATADDANERKTTPLHQLSRHWSLMEACSRALAGFPVWSHRSDAQTSQARCERARAAIGRRLKKFGDS